MKVLYLVNMSEGNYGGLFKATYERLKGHQNKKDIVNLHYYDQKLISKVKTNLFKKPPFEKAKSSYPYKELEINNFNIKRDLTYYMNRMAKKEKKNMDKMVDLFLSENNYNLSETDLIHAHWGYPNGYLAYRLAEKYEIPYFITFHGNDINNSREIEREYLLEAMEKAAKCFFVSNQLLENAKKLGYSGDNAIVTHNGVDTEEFTIMEERRKDQKVIGYIGVLEKIKGADLLADIYSAIKEKYPKSEFIVIGDGPLKESIEEKAIKRELEVEFIKQLPFEEIPSYLKKIDLLVMPSRNEGFGMIILEANAMGIPVVATNVGGIPEAIGYEENLITFDEDLIENMAQRTVEILTSPKVDQEKYRNRVVEKFSWESIVELESFYYREAINDKTEGITKKLK